MSNILSDNSAAGETQSRQSYVALPVASHCAQSSRP